MSSPFSTEAYNFLKLLGCNNFKIASGEVTNIPLLERINEDKTSNVFLSTGMSNWAETTIIVRFWIINGIAVVIGLGLFYSDYVLFGQ